MPSFISGANITDLCGEVAENSRIDMKLYEKYHVKRGLRNSDGTGVVAGITNICNVHGYVLNEGEVEPIPGQLIYRGHSINDLVENVEAEDRFGYEETVFLLLFGRLPKVKELKNFNTYLSLKRDLPGGFVEDMILKAPSKNIMNKLARSVLALYSYDDECENKGLESEMRTAISLIAKLPVIMANAYQVKRRVFDNQSMIMHPINYEENTAQCILSLLRNDRQYTKEEAQMLDCLLMLQAEHGGGNNSTFTCRVLTSSGTDPYSAYSSAICSLKGPRHGGANIQVIQMLDNFKANIKHWDNEGEVADYMRKTIRKETNDGSGLIYGMFIRFQIHVRLSSRKKLSSLLRARKLKQNSDFLKLLKDLLLRYLRKSRAALKPCAPTLICIPDLFTECSEFRMNCLLRSLQLHVWQAGLLTVWKRS